MASWEKCLSLQSYPAGEQETFESTQKAGAAVTHVCKDAESAKHETTARVYRKTWLFFFKSSWVAGKALCLELNDLEFWVGSCLFLDMVIHRTSQSLNFHIWKMIIIQSLPPSIFILKVKWVYDASKYETAVSIKNNPMTNFKCSNSNANLKELYRQSISL